MGDDNLDGIVNPTLSISITPPVGAGVETDFLGILDAKFPKRAYKTTKYIPQGGQTAHLEQVRVGSSLADTLSATLLLDPITFLALDTAAGINGCTLSATATGVGTWAGTGFIEVVDVEKFDDTKQVQATVTLNFNAGWTFTPDTGALIVIPTYTFHVASGATNLVLTACGPLGTATLIGTKITKIAVKALTTNANSITVAAGTYAPPTTYSVILLAGQSDILTIPVAYAVAVTAGETLVVTGTGTQGIEISFEAVVP
jgi:hypothetical protein